MADRVVAGPSHSGPPAHAPEKVTLGPSRGCLAQLQSSKGSSGPCGKLRPPLRREANAFQGRTRAVFSLFHRLVGTHPGPLPSRYYMEQRKP